MTAVDPHSRDELRQTYVDAWRKHRAGMPLAPLEVMLADLIGQHPEYQALLENPERLSGLDAAATGTAENPFLHLGLHMAVHEQFAIDRPPGVRELHGRLTALRGDRHGADHEMMDALAETLWEAQRSGQAPDEVRYLDRVRRRLKLPTEG